MLGAQLGDAVWHDRIGRVILIRNAVRNISVDLLGTKMDYSTNVKEAHRLKYVDRAAHIDGQDVSWTFHRRLNTNDGGTMNDRVGRDILDCRYDICRVSNVTMTQR